MSLCESDSVSSVSAIRKRGMALHISAPPCTNIYVVTARAWWPRKTAENWAEAAGVKPRIAKYWLAGREINAEGKLAIRDLFD